MANKPKMTITLNDESKTMLLAACDLAELQHKITELRTAPAIIDRSGFGLYKRVSKALKADIEINGELVFCSGKTNPDIEVHWLGDNAPEVEMVRISSHRRLSDIYCSPNLDISSFDVATREGVVIRENCTLVHVLNYVKAFTENKAFYTEDIA